MAFSIQPKPKQPHPSTRSPRYFLHQHLVRDEPARPYTHVHASDLMKSPDFCSREYALGVKHLLSRPDERISAAESVTFAYGRYVEKQVRLWFAECGRAIGDWRCLACNQLHAWTRLPGKCKKCSAPRECIVYEERTFRSKKSGIGCRPDLFLDFGRPKLTLLEIKSMDKEQFKGLVAPLAEHRWRTNLYMRNVEESEAEHADEVDCQDAFVIYVTKGGYGFKDDEIRLWKLNDGDFSPFKEYEVERDDSQTDALVAAATQYHEFKKGGPLPPRICPTSLVKRAKWCTASHVCWSTPV